MFPDPEALQPDRVRQKLCKGWSPAQIAIWFASDTIAHVLSTYTAEPLDILMQKLQKNLILEIEEKIEIVSFILNDQKEPALDKLCAYLSRKSAEDIIQFQDILQTRTPELATYLSVVIGICEEASKQEEIQKRSDTCKF